MKFHKKFHVVALLAAILALNAQAAEVSSVQVKRAVSAWAAANGSAFANPGSVTGATPVAENGTNLYWIVTMSNGGAVIASPDTDLDLVIAVLEKYEGSFPAGHPLPSILKKDMKNRLSIIRSGSTSSSSSSNSGVRSASMLSATTQSTAAELPEDVKSSVLKANALWAKYDRVNGGISLLADSLTGGDASPYVRRIVDGFEQGGRYTHWNQSTSPIDGEPLYNLHTPRNAVCGCVATAGSAIMQFFACTNDIDEVQGVGCSYNGNEKFADFKTLPGAQDWSIFPTNGVSEVQMFAATNTVARDLIGRVAYNMGVLVGMAWTDGESGADTLKLADAFKKYGFKNATAVEYGDNLKGTAPFFKAIYAQNWAGAPVVMSIHGDRGGHAVVACGYARDGDGDEFCRVFMGWGGSGDSWFKFPNVESFNIIKGAVSMLGYQQEVEVEGYDSTVGIESDAVVPVCGRANVKNTTLMIPGGTYKVQVDEEAMEATVVPADLVVPVDENGYFATRIPLSMKNPMIVHPESGASMEITPFDSKAMAKPELNYADAEAAIPGELVFLVLNMEIAPTVDAARARALEDGKALLMVSGAGSLREAALIDYLTYLDSTNDLASCFVLVRINSADSTSVQADGDPSIGVFDPAEGSADLRWWESNGRLAYDNFIDYGAENSENLNYTFTVDNTANLTNSVNTVLLVGYDSYLRRHSGISVVVDSTDEDGSPLHIGAVSPAIGTYENCWTNGEEVVFTTLSTYTNINEGVIYSCVGWATNEVYVGTNSTTAAIKLNEGEQIRFTWLWKASHYQVTASPSGLPAFGLPSDVVTPENEWVEAGARVTLAAKVELGNYKLKEWVLSRSNAANEVNADYKAYYNGYNDVNAAVVQNGNTVSFSVYEPVSVAANYSTGTSSNPIVGEAKAYAVEIVSSPAEFADKVSLKYGYEWGTNATIDPVFHLEPTVQSYVDATGGVWTCMGWEIDGTKYEDVELLFELYVSDQVIPVKCLWGIKPQNPQPGTGSDDDEDDDSVEPVLVPIAFSSIAQDASGVWTLTLTNAVKDCWYHLEYTDSLSPVNWVPAGSIQATQDGPITFQEVGNAAGGGRFWRAKATSTETGN